MDHHISKLGIPIALAAVLAAWHEPAARTQDRVVAGNDVDLLLARHLAAVDEYRQAFANLVADETRVIELYDEKGKRDKRRTIESDLLVYSSFRNGQQDAAGQSQRAGRSHSAPPLGAAGSGSVISAGSSTW